MPIDIFEFWKQAADAGVLERPGKKFHPADEAILESHDWGTFDLENHPEPFYGPLRTAPIVFLALNHNGDDSEFIDNPDMIAAHKRAWDGNEPLWRANDFLPPGRLKWDWMASLVKRLGMTDWEVVKSKVAILNISSYRSPRSRDPWALTELPSSKVAVEWAKEVLIPEARLKERIVICIYGAKYFGLENGTVDGHLFAKADRGEILKVDRPPIVAAINDRLGATM